MATQTGVIPLTAPNIAWGTFIKDIAELTSHSPTRGIDSSNYKLSDYGKYIVALGEFQSGNEEKPLQILNNSDHLLDHLFFSFLFFGPSILTFKIMEFTNLFVISTRTKEKGRASIVSGTLRQWKQSIFICLQSQTSWIKIPKEIRLTFHNCMDFFVRFGLGNIFDNYRKIKLDDGTFLLEKK